MKALKVVFVTALIVCIAGFGFAAETATRTAKVTEAKGNVEVTTSTGQTMAAAVGMVLKQGDRISTKANSWAVLDLDGDAETASVEVKPNSKMMIAELKEDKTESTQATLLDLSIGEILIKAKKIHSAKSKFEVKTPTSIVGVKGTTFSVAVEAVE